jgi:hypothetical protein
MYWNNIVSDITDLQINNFHTIPVFKKYLHFFMTMHKVTTCPSMRYVFALHGLNCYIIVLRAMQMWLNFIYIYLMNINTSNIIKLPYLN